MTSMPFARFHAALGIALCSVTISVAARGEPNATRCVVAAERGQKERDEGRLVASRATFASCGDQACPMVIRRECLHWLAEIEERIPSIVISVKDGSAKDVVDAEVTLDGERLASANRGREVLVDPGPHRIAAKRAGAPDVEETILVREREKGRMLSLVLETPPIVPTAPIAPVPAHGSAAVPVFSWILAGTALVGGAGFAYFWSTGVDRVHELRSTCAPRCSDGEVDEASRLLRAGHLSLGIGIAAAVGAVVVYLLQPDQPSSPRRATSAGGLRF
jgi:hypothetical protein